MLNSIWFSFKSSGKPYQVIRPNRFYQGERIIYLVDLSPPNDFSPSNLIKMKCDSSKQFVPIKWNFEGFDSFRWGTWWGIGYTCSESRSFEPRRGVRRSTHELHRNELIVDPSALCWFLHKWSLFTLKLWVFNYDTESTIKLFTSWKL